MVAATMSGRTAHNPLMAFAALVFAGLDPLVARYVALCRAVNALIDELKASDRIEAIVEAQLAGTRLEQSASAKQVGKGLVTIALVVVILNQIFTIDIINNSTGPFSGIISTVESIGGAALTLLTLAFLVLGGAVAMRFMDRF